MNKIQLPFACFLTLILFSGIPIKAETAWISFLKKNVSVSKDSINNQYIFDNLLTEDSKQWIDSFECENVKANTPFVNSDYNSGLILQPKYVSKNFHNSGVMINFNTEKPIRAKQIIIYTALRGVTNRRWDPKVDINLEFACNGKQEQDMSKIPNPLENSKTKPNGTETASDLQKLIMNGEAVTLEWKTPELTSTEPLKTIEITAIRPSKEDPYYSQAKIFAVKIDYDKDFSVGVNEVEQDDMNAAAEYYDLTGRKLNATPENGIYIVKTGSKVNKILVR